MLRAQEVGERRERALNALRLPRRVLRLLRGERPVPPSPLTRQIDGTLISGGAPFVLGLTTSSAPLDNTSGHYELLATAYLKL